MDILEKDTDYSMLLFHIFICLFVGGLSILISMDGVPDWFVQLNKPWFYPPVELYLPVWAFLYTLMGISVSFIWNKDTNKPEIKQALLVFYIQLVLNFLWTPLFFGAGLIGYALVDMILLLTFIILTMYRFYPISKKAAHILIPYLVWIIFETILNASLWILN